ncbi:restriction endonuclease subunit S [Prevotella sp. FD3004]|uniref:restriction endonuclease subunit S n=1 Tax=Prevotella sp. FD3004 TaxID=1408309 RepID=UPI000691A9A3|nr:restriction endonuclease subunit S [Prevotella sp. FD3004]
MKEGWTYKTIKECCTELFAGGDVPKPDVSKNKTQYFTVPIYTNGAENEGLYGYTNNARVYEPAVTISARGTIGATFRRYTPFYPAIRLITAVPKRDLLSIDYLYYALKTLSVGDSGTSIPQLTIPKIKNLVLPVPPLSEQQSIVDYLDSAFAKIDTMKTNAEKALNEAKSLFQATLKEMLEPKEGWEEKTLPEISENLDSIRKPVTKNKRTAGIYPYYGASGIVDYVDDYLFDEDLLCVSEDGANLLMRTYPIAFPISGKVWVNNHAHVLRFKSKITQKFVEYYFSEMKLDEYITGAAQPKLTQKALNSIIINMPISLEKQQSIVETLDSLKSKVDRLQENYDKISQECDALKQAILRQVFE